MSLTPLRRAISYTNRRTFSTTPQAFNISSESKDIPRPPPTEPYSTAPKVARVSPESPSYIEIPRPPQIRSFPIPRQKGKLPHPRSVPQNLDAAAATLEPSQDPREPITGINEETAEYIKWKGRLAETRRRNLREGLAELQKRQKDQQARRAEVLRKRSEEREARLQAKQREDVRLTLPSILSTLRHDDGSNMLRITPERLEEKRAIREAKEAQKAAARIENFHELYLNAKDFILTEKQLDEAIEKVFTLRDHLYKGLPQTVEDMLLQVANSQSRFSRDPKIMEIAGQLTGAKLGPEKKGMRDSDAFGRDMEGDMRISRDFS